MDGSGRCGGVGPLLQEGSGPGHGGPDWLDRLSATLRAEVIPRLVSAHESARPSARVPERRGIPAHEVHEFAHLVLAQDGGVVREWVDRVRARGLSPEMLCLELLAPAARRLGELWVADLCDFTQVTLGLWRLQQVQHEMGALMHADPMGCPGSRRVLLATLPVEQHTYGVLMLADFFRQRQWDVCVDVPGRGRHTLRMLQTQHFDLLGLSLGSENRLDELADWISMARRAAHHREMMILVGGPIFVDRPDLATMVGADGTAGDAASAMDVADALVPVYAPMAEAN